MLFTITHPTIRNLRFSSYKLGSWRFFISGQRWQNAENTFGYQVWQGTGCSANWSLWRKHLEFKTSNWPLSSSPLGECHISKNLGPGCKTLQSWIIQIRTTLSVYPEWCTIMTRLSAWVFHNNPSSHYAVLAGINIAIPTDWFSLSQFSIRIPLSSPLIMRKPGCYYWLE